MEQEILIMENGKGKIITNPQLAKKIRTRFPDMQNTKVIDALIYLSQQA